ncbi:MAG TPA: FAD-dependent oxidoreductase [Solirubrobacteraceae bacterium]|jgi:3-phenylpropionate/trans-cinnamate dioxygenase ferredoxin reductase subunit
MSTRRVRYLLIGGGLASASAAQTLREEGADGEIMLVGREPDPPYHRPPCSKGYLQGAEGREDTLVCPVSWYEENDVRLLTRTSVTSLDLDARTATLSNKEEVSFEQALIATGANVRRLNVPGGELEQIHYLRTLGNADTIRDAVQDAEHVVLIGGSYIGCEVAASLTLLGKRCSIVMQEQVTLERGFGQRAGRVFDELLRANGVEIYAEDELDSFEGEGRVRTVLTRAGRRLQADAVVIGAGVAPDVRLAQSAGLRIGERGGIRCNSRLESSVSGVYAAGDACEYESVVHDGRPLRIEHWDVAFNHGKTAALNMLGRDTPHDVVPYFFSDLADWASLEYVGPASEWDREIVRGSLEQREFSNWYLKDGRVLAALSVGRSEDLEQAKRLISDASILDDSQQALLADPAADIQALAA